MEELKQAIENLAISGPEKEMLMGHIRSAEKSMSILEFKYNRTVFDKHAITNVLNASIEEIEKQKKIVEAAKNEVNQNMIEIEKQKKQLEKEIAKSDALLLNILPEEIARELKAFGRSYARRHENVSVLFADICGFTSIAENLPADLLVTQLDELFRGFDFIIGKYDLEKIKTIGDCYMCAGGLPEENGNHALKCVMAGLDMQQFVSDLSRSKLIQGLPMFEIRVGINTGSVISGVVGTTKFVYDIWGETVNLASQMEQLCDVGQVNVSDSTYSLLNGELLCEHRGEITTKNGRPVNMYFVKKHG